MLHESNGNDGIVAAGRFAVVVQSDVDRQLRMALLGPGPLLARDRVADDAGPVVLGGECREAAPAAAKVEDAHAWSRADLATYQIELGRLGSVQVVRAFPVGAGIDHALAEHGLVQIVANVVVAVAHFESSR